MKICLPCRRFFQEQMRCDVCGKVLQTVALSEALNLTESRSLSRHIRGRDQRELSDAHIQYHIRSYLGNRSLFLDFDLHKNRLRHGRRLKRFFIAPVNMTAVFNIPWFFFNVLSSNMFHLKYTAFCRRCQCKIDPPAHSPEECDYYIEYFHILDDILSGQFSGRKHIYRKYSRERRGLGCRSAYHDLVERSAPWEAFLDVISITMSIFFWLFIAVYISYPWIRVLVQRLEQIDHYELIIL